MTKFHIMKSINPHFLITVFLFFLFSCENDENSINLPPSTVQITNIEIQYENTPVVTVIANWSAATDPENDVIKYRVFLEKYITNSEETEVIDTRFFENLIYINDEVDQNERYRIRIIAVDSNNNESAPVVRNLDVLPVNQPPPRVIGITIDENRLINWNESVDPENEEVKYNLSLEKQIVNTEDYEVVDTRTNYASTTYNSNGLIVNSINYRIVITAVDSFGNESEPTTKYFLVQGTEPSPIENFNYTIDPSNNLNITWSSNPSFSTYRVQVFKLSWDFIAFTFPVHDYVMDFEIEANTNSISIAGLNLFTSYSIHVIPVSETNYLPSLDIVKTIPVGSYTGDIILYHQFYVDLFEDHQLEEVNGNIIIGASGFNGFDGLVQWSIGDLSPLNGIKTITGNLEFGKDLTDFPGDVNYGLNLSELSGFSELENIGGSFINRLNIPSIDFPNLSSLGSIKLNATVPEINLPNLFELNGNLIINDDITSIKINNISNILNLVINNAPSLEIIEFSNLETIENNLIINNTNLTNLNSFSNLSNVGNTIKIINNNTINSISILSNDFTLTGNLEISNNNSLTTLEGFSGLTQVENLNIVNNASLESINGFNNVSQIGNILIKDNTNLNSINGFSNNFSITGNLDIGDNTLTSLEGFNGLTQVSNLNIYNNSNLSSINGFTNLSSILNDFIIQNNGISSLTSFNNLTQVTNNFSIKFNANLNSINGFSGLTQVNNLVIKNNTNLNTINGFNNLNIITDKLLVQSNPQLNNLNNFTALNFLGNGLLISNNTNLTTLNLNTFNSNTNNVFEINITNNTNLSNIQGLSNLQNIDKLLFKDNNNLTTFDLTNLTTVANYIALVNNDSISTLDFLTNLTLIDCGTAYSFNGHNGNLLLDGNFNLHDFCGLTNFFTNTGLCSNEYYINQNAFNPTHQDIINGDCSN